MKSQYTELGIFINPHKIVKSFDENGANNDLASARDENEKKLMLLKKGSSVRPVKNFKSPEKDDSSHSQVSLAYTFIGKLESLVSSTDQEKIKKIIESLKNERFKSLKYDSVSSPDEAKVLLDRVKFDYKKYLEFFDQKRAYEKELKEYESYSSDQYIKTSLAFKLARKIETLLTLIAKNKEKPEKVRSEQIVKLTNDLQGGISKPVFNKGGERQYVMKFSDLYTIPNDEVGLATLLTTIRSEFKNDLELFNKKNSLKHDSLKFSPPIHAVVTYIVQETVRDALRLAAKVCKSSQKASISIEHVAPEVLIQSPFWPVLYNLPCMQVLAQYMDRRNKYNEETKQFKNSRNKYLKINSFYDMEKKNGFMTDTEKKGNLIVKGKKFWEGLNSTNEQFTSSVNKIFEKVKADGKLKLKLSDRAREFLSIIISQMLKVISERFTIHRKHKCKIDPLIKKSNKTRPEEKSIKFETVVEMFDLVFCPKTKETTEIIETICQFKNKLKK